jgi:acyl-CoA synthetase (NDP forming)
MPDLTRLLKPRAIAVIGASNDAESPRGRIMKTIWRNGFAGPVYPVSRSASEIMGRSAFARVRDLPEPVDLALLLVPAAAVAPALEDCANAGITAAVVMASGFSEEGDEAALARQQALLEVATRRHMTVMGPNCLGFADFTTGLAATFSPVMETLDPPLPYAVPETARIGVLSQSGALGFGLVDNALARGLPVARIIATGNEAALDMTDYLDHLLAEGDTDVFLLYVESVRRPAALAASALKALEAGKPIIAVKVGRSEVGRRAAVAHTGAFAGSDAGWNALCWRTGIVQAVDLDEAVDLASCFARHRGRLPRGRRVGIVASSGGGGAWLADCCIGQGLEVPALDVPTCEAIDALLPSYGSSANPVDTTAQVMRERSYSRFCELLGSSPAIDSVIAVCTSRSAETLGLETNALDKLGEALTKPLLFYSYTPPSPESVGIFKGAGLPVTTSLRNAARAVVAMVGYADARVRHDAAANLPPPSLDSGARERVAKGLKRGGPVLCEVDARALLVDYGVPNDGACLAAAAAAAGEAVRALGGPVALKIQSPDITHKTEAGGVLLGIETSAAAEAGFTEIISSARAFRPDAEIWGVLVQPMASPGIEMIVGASVDPDYGPLVMVGLGGVFVEVYGDVAFAPAPLYPPHARSLLESLTGWPILQGARGAGPADVGALVDLIVGLSQFAADHAGALAEIDLNPVIVHPEGEGVSVADALIVCGRTSDKQVASD